MNQENWQKVKEVFYSALNKPEPDRHAYLDVACLGDPAFRSEVEMLLNSYESGFLEDSLWPDRIGEEEEPFKPFFNAGDEFNHYSIVKLIGRGGMGEVYLADDKTLDRPVAIKVVSQRSGFGEIAEKRLLREARAAARLDHPNICSVYEVGETQGRPFIAMQYVDGETLDARIKRGPIPFDECVLITRKIAAALSEAHAQGIVHRDIKPANIIIDARGQLKVLDFGLAKRSLMIEGTNESQLSEVGIIAGTAAFMSPEQARGQQVDPRTDIWSLGVVFYQMLTGKLPFTGISNADTVSAILSKEFRLASTLVDGIPHGTDEIIATSLQKDLERRHEDIEAFVTDLVNIEQAAVARSAQTLKALYVSPSLLRSTMKNSTVLPVGILVTAAIVFFIVLSAMLLKSYSSESQSFADVSANRLRSSTLFSTKHKQNGQLADMKFSPDGNLLSFVIWGEGKSAVYVKQKSGGEPKQITDGNWADQTPVWSGDSQRLAFVSNRNKQAGVWYVPYLGGSPILLTALELDPSNYQLLKWDEGTDSIYYESAGSLRKLNVTNGGSAPVNVGNIEGKIDGDFAISPDGKKIAFVAEANGNYSVWIKSDDGTLKALDGGDFRSSSPVWFPDNHRLAYTSEMTGNSQIFIYDPSSNQSRQVTFSDSAAVNPIVSPDGSELAYTSSFSEANIYSYNITSGIETRLTSNVRLQLLGNISPSGEEFAFQSTTDSSNFYVSPLKIKRMSSDPETISLPSTGYCPNWSPLGNEIAFFKNSGSESGIWKIDVNTLRESRITTATTSSFGHSVSPYNMMLSVFDWAQDGKSIAFVSKSSGQHNIWTSNADGTNEKQVTKYVAQESKAASSPIWSHDGKRIAYIESRSNGPIARSTDNYVAVIDGENITNVAKTEGKTRLLSWSANDIGVFVAVEKDADTSLVYLDLVNHSIKTVATLPSANINGVLSSRDGKWVAFSARIDRVDNIFLVSTGGGKPRRLTANADDTLFFSGLAWSADACTLLYSKQTGGTQISLISEAKN